MPITTASAFKTYRGISTTDYDTRLGAIVPAVCEAIERYCGVRSDEDDVEGVGGFDTQTYTDRAHSGDGTAYLLLRHWPVTAVESVKIRTTTGDETTLQSNTYRYTQWGKIELLDSHAVRFDLGYSTVTGRLIGNSPCFPVGFRNVLVTYTAGYSTIPNQMTLAAFGLITEQLAKEGTAGTNFTSAAIQSETLGQHSVTYRADMTPGISITGEYARLLEPFRRRYI